jgi:hypothetical protein
MPGTETIHRTVIALTVLAFVVSSCSMESPTAVDQNTDAVTETPEAAQETLAVSFVQPADCTDILPENVVEGLANDGIELVRGPGSPSPDSIYVEGQTPEELLGGFSCLFAPPGEEDTGINIVLSVAAVDESVRPGIISSFVEEGLNVGQTTDGTGLTYWRWGDDINVTALHNALYQDSWYSALIQPGGRSAYDRGVSWVDSMRAHTTR